MQAIRTMADMSSQHHAARPPCERWASGQSSRLLTVEPAVDCRADC
jgi:hypothetical protein